VLQQSGSDYAQSEEFILTLNEYVGPAHSRADICASCGSILASTPPGMPGTHPPIFWLGGRQREYPPQYYYVLSDIADQYWLPQADFIRLFIKTPPVRFSQAGGQSAHKARPPNLELALTPLRQQSSYWSIYAARAQQQTRRPPLLLSIDGTDRRTDAGVSTVSWRLSYRILHEMRHSLRIHRWQWRHFVPVDFCRRLVGKTLGNVRHYGST